MIEELEHALKRGAKIYCELAGYGAASDDYHVAATHPEGLGPLWLCKVPYPMPDWQPVMSPISMHTPLLHR